MANIIDLKKEYFKRNFTGADSSNIIDLELQFYKQELGVTSGNVRDLEQRWLTSVGATGTNLEDQWRVVLTAASYTVGNNQDDKKGYYTNE